MEEINSGGSLGDFFRPEFKSLSELNVFLRTFAGDLYTSNFFFLDKIRDLYVADLGCGYGYNTIALSTYVKKIDAFDVDSDAISYANYKLKPLLDKQNCNFTVLDGYNTHKDSNTYDAILSFEVIEHVPLPDLYLNEAQRILKKGGKIYLSTPNGLIANKNNCIIKYHSREHLTEYFPSELQNMLNNAGFLLDQFYIKLNKESDYKRNINENPLRRLKIKVICTLKINRLTYRILKKIFVVFKRKHQKEDNYLNYIFKKVQPAEITSLNCDVILVEAHKV
jgi:2-polyprenyl-3-methyl-5-hydroxy-6-metoxy-1,4-benzoquinol methylase